MILALGPTLVLFFAAKGELRGITQAYTQSHDPLTRTFIAQLPAELQNKYPPDTVLSIEKPLYGLAESGLHWYKTYHTHHIEALKITCTEFHTPVQSHLLSKTSYGRLQKPQERILAARRPRQQRRQKPVSSRVGRARITCPRKHRGYSNVSVRLEEIRGQAGKR
jgi:hypothetical protein